MRKQIIEAWFEIWDKDRLVIKAHNDIVDKGVRWIMSAISNSLAGDGYPANALKYIHYGSGNTAFDPTDWHLESYTGSLGQITTVVKTSDILVTMSLAYTTGGTPIYISELAIGVTANDPANALDYANAVLDRAVLPQTVIIPPLETRTITYRMKINTS